MELDLTEEKLLQLFKIIKINPDPETIMDIKRSIEILKKDLNLINKFNLNKVEPMARISEKELSLSLLREDILVKKVTEEKYIFNNAFSYEGDYIKIGRVVFDKT